MQLPEAAQQAVLECIVLASIVKAAIRGAGATSPEPAQTQRQRRRLSWRRALSVFSRGLSRPLAPPETLRLQKRPGRGNMGRPRSVSLGSREQVVQRKNAGPVLRMHRPSAPPRPQGTRPAHRGPDEARPGRPSSLLQEGSGSAARLCRLVLLLKPRNLLSSDRLRAVLRGAAQARGRRTSPASVCRAPWLGLLAQCRETECMRDNRRAALGPGKRRKRETQLTSSAAVAAGAGLMLLTLRRSASMPLTPSPARKPLVLGRGGPSGERSSPGERRNEGDPSSSSKAPPSRRITSSIRPPLSPLQAPTTVSKETPGVHRRLPTLHRSDPGASKLTVTEQERGRQGRTLASGPCYPLPCRLQGRGEETPFEEHLRGGPHSPP